MSRTITPSAREAQEIAQFLDGQSAVPCGEELLSALIRLATERVLQETREQEQTEARGRGLYARQETSQGYRTGYAEGTLKTAEGILRLPLPPVRGRREPYRSKLWAALGRTSDVLTTLIVEMYAGGMAQRDVDGRKVLLTLSTAHSESYDRCLEVLRARGQRGLQPPGTSTTAGAPGLSHAVEAMWPRSLRLRGWVHTMQNLYQQVPPPAWPACKALGAAMREAPTCEEGQRRRQPWRDESQGPLPEAWRCLADEAEASLKHLKVPARPRQYVRTSNLAGRACEEERRRPKVIPPLWEEPSLLPWVCAVLMRVRERWGKKPCREFAQHQMRALRQS
jgi:transposase-like protein